MLKHTHTHTLRKAPLQKAKSCVFKEKDLLCITALVAGFQHSEVDKWCTSLGWPAL